MDLSVQEIDLIETLRVVPGRCKDTIGGGRRACQIGISHGDDDGVWEVSMYVYSPGDKHGKEGGIIERGVGASFAEAWANLKHEYDE